MVVFVGWCVGCYCFLVGFGCVGVVGVVLVLVMLVWWL